MTGRPLLLTAALLTIAFLTAGAVGGHAREVVQIRVSGHFFSEPATVQLIVAVEPDSDNRVLRVEADSDTLFRSTEVNLDGLDEKRLHTIEFKNLPAGAYEVRAEVLSSSTVRAMATEELMVMGRAR
jgi:hypothetical protein